MAAWHGYYSGGMYKNSDARERVLALAQQRRVVSVDEVAAELAIVPVTARSHLNALTQQGLLKTALDRGHVGRPRLRFSPTEKAEQLLPNRYAALAVDLIASLAALAGQRGLEQVLDAAAATYATANQHLVGGALAARVPAVTRILEQESGEATWEGYGPAALLSTSSTVHMPTLRGSTARSAATTYRRSRNC